MVALTPFVQGLLLGVAAGAALLKALEMIVEEWRRIKAYERARERLRCFIQGDEEVRE